MNSKQEVYQISKLALETARTLKAEAMTEYEWMLDCDPDSAEFDKYTDVEMEMEDRYNIRMLQEAFKASEDALIKWALTFAHMNKPVEMANDVDNAVAILSATKNVTARRRIAEAAMKL
jgi:hypothetical protein